MKKHVLAALVTLLTCVGVRTTYAQALPPGNTPASSVSVSPVIENLKLAPDQDSADFKVKITNHKDVQVRISLGFNDFKSLNQSGGVAFLGQNPSALDQSHGLRSSVQFDTEQVGLEPDQSTEVNVHLANLQSLSPGGHYGAVLYQLVPAAINGNGTKVHINQVLASLVFVVTANGGTEQLKMPDPVVKKLQFSIPDKIDLFFTNDGNTQTTPRGSVAVYQSKAQQPAATGIVNKGSALVLPGSTRILRTDLTRVKKPWWPQHYHVQVRYRADTATQFTTYTAQFLYVNPVALAISLAVAVVGLVILRQIIKHRRRFIIFAPLFKPFAKVRTASVTKKKATPVKQNATSAKKRSGALHKILLETRLVWRDLGLGVSAVAKKLRRLGHTIRIETILVWRDLKLLFKHMFRTSPKQSKSKTPKAAKKPVPNMKKSIPKTAAKKARKTTKK